MDQDILEIVTIANKWQELLGAALGVMVSVILGVLAYYIKKYLDHRERLQMIDRVLVTAIKSAIESKITLEHFYNKQFLPLKESLNQDGKYSLNLIFIPEISGGSFDLDIAEIRTGSGYLDSNLLMCRSLSKDIELGISGSKIQLQETNNLYNQVALGKHIEPDEQTAHLKNALDSFSTAFYLVLINHNHKVLIKKLIETKVALDYYQGSFLRWKYRFRKTLKFYKSKKELESEYIFKKMDNFFENDVKILEEKVNMSVPKIESNIEKVLSGQ